jgi:hypothetical protein
MFAYVGSFTSAQRKARGDGIHIYRADAATGAWTHVQHVGDLMNPSLRVDAGSGRLAPTGQVIANGSPVTLVFAGRR